MRHFQTLVQVDSTDPPGNETRMADSSSAFWKQKASS